MRLHLVNVRLHLVKVRSHQTYLKIFCPFGAPAHRQGAPRPVSNKIFEKNRRVWCARTSPRCARTKLLQNFFGRLVRPHQTRLGENNDFLSFCFGLSPYSSYNFEYSSHSLTFSLFKLVRSSHHTDFSATSDRLFTTLKSTKFGDLAIFGFLGFYIWGFSSPCW